jgi:hypothetical protein
MVLSVTGIDPLLNRCDETSFRYAEHVDLVERKEVCNLRGFKIKPILASSQASSVGKVENASVL